MLATMTHMLLFGPGYVGSRLAAALAADGWTVTAVRRDTPAAAVEAISRASHILSSVPPTDTGDPILDRWGPAIAAAPAGWVGYLSSTGVYGDTGGAWVDESAPIGGGRRSARAEADAAWQRIHAGARVFRLPGIYGPGRSPLDRVRAGTAHRIDLPGQIFSRIHVDDILSGIRAAIAGGPAGVYNLADDLPASQADVVAAAAGLLGLPPPPLTTLDEAGLSPAARAFYAENRRVAAGKARRLLGWRPRYPTYREGLASLAAAPAGTDPAQLGHITSAAADQSRPNLMPRLR